MFRLDSADFQTVGSLIVLFEQLFLNKVEPIKEKQKKNRMKLDLRAKIENPNILLYVQPHPQGILLSWYWKRKSFPQSDTRKVKCLRDKNAVYMNTQYMYIRTQIYNLCDLFMLALQHHLRLVTVQWCSFLFPNNLYWRNWSGKKQVNANRKKKNLGRKRRSRKSSW